MSRSFSILGNRRHHRFQRLKLMKEVMDTRYPTADWNIYAAQTSDGDNWNDDSLRCNKCWLPDILTQTHFYSYIEITPHEQSDALA